MNKEKIGGRNVLTIGCECDPPRGGVAQVLYTYKNEVYERFRFVANSGEGGKIKKLWQAVRGYFQTAFILLTDNRIKIVHIHTASYVSFRRSSYFVKLAKALGKKVVLHIHGGGFKEYYQTNPDWILNILSRADCNIALTDFWKQFFQDELKLPYVVTVYNIIPYPTILGVEHDNKVHLLFLGAINENKGIYDLLDVLNRNKEEWKDRLFLHVGGNQEIERLLSYIKANHLENMVSYEGWVEGEKKLHLLNLMDAFILPSYIEGLPISILESLSYGKPVITTPVGGIPEVVNSENGFMFEPGDKDALSELLSSIIRNPTILQEKGKKASMSVDFNYPHSISSTLSKVYNSLL